MSFVIEALIPKLREQEDTGKGNAESQSQDLEIIEDVLCKACNLEIYGQAYGCESCKYYLHNQCAKLSYEVFHPLHPHHPLHLYKGGDFYCGECGDVSAGFGYVCYLCGFMLDLKCFTLKEPKVQRLKEMARESKTKLCLFQQDHELFFANFSQDFENYPCSICFLPISGRNYACFRCGYALHESCLGFPWEMALPFHPEHPLHPILNHFFDVFCLACRGPTRTESIVYNCQQCRHISLHFLCANSLWRPLESRSHPHPLFYFGTECQKLFK
ncbi:DC1 - like 10, partial [Theobroma cacao]